MKLTVQRPEGMDDWYLIERAEHDGREWIEDSSLMCSSRFSDADVEGTGAEMLAIAEAIEKRDTAHFKRCAVNARTKSVVFWSPRNSRVEGECSLAEADALAAEIREKIKSVSK